MLKIDRQTSVETQSEGISTLYDKYGAMLLGYIFEILKDRRLAEDCLVQLFCDLSQKVDKINWDKNSKWIQLQRFAREKLTTFVAIQQHNESVAEESAGLIHDSDNKYLEQLTNEQRQIFYAIYYYGRSVAAISAELNKTEESIRKNLKEAFDILKRDGEN